MFVIVQGQRYDVAIGDALFKKAVAEKTEEESVRREREAAPVEDAQIPPGMGGEEGSRRRDLFTRFAGS